MLGDTAWRVSRQQLRGEGREGIREQGSNRFSSIFAQSAQLKKMDLSNPTTPPSTGCSTQQRGSSAQLGSPKMLHPPCPPPTSTALPDPIHSLPHSAPGADPSPLPCPPNRIPTSKGTLRPDSIPRVLPHPTVPRPSRFPKQKFFSEGSRTHFSGGRGEPPPAA